MTNLTPRRQARERNCPAAINLFLALVAYLILSPCLITRASTLTWSASANTIWDYAAVNWTGQTYTNGDVVYFGDPIPGGGTVQLSATGIAPGGVQVANTSGTYTFSGSFGIGGTCSLIKTNGGTLVISNSNSYTGGTTIGGGTLVVANGDISLGGSTGALTLGGAALKVNNKAWITSRPINVTVNNGIIDTGTFNCVSSGPVGGSGFLIKAGNGDFAFGGSVGSLGAGVGLSVLAGSLTFNQQGSQFVDAPKTTGSFAGDLNLGSGVALEFTGTQSALSPEYISGGGRVNFQVSGASLTSDGAIEIDNNVQLNSNSTGSGFSSSFVIIGSGQIVFGGTISGSSDVVFSSVGPYSAIPIFQINKPANYTGNTTLNFVVNGALRLGAINALPTTTKLAFDANAGSLDLNGYNQTVAGLSDQGGDNGITNSSGNWATLTINQNINTVFSSYIGTPLYTNAFPNVTTFTNINLVKTGTGTLQLYGNPDYTGSTSVLNGTLIISGGISGNNGLQQTSLVTVGSGATLAGNGYVGVQTAGQVIIQSGGVFLPGQDAPGTGQTAAFQVYDFGPTYASGGTFDLESGGKIVFNLNTTGSLSQLDVAGTITLAGQLQLALGAGFTAHVGDLYFIILNQGANPINGAFSNAPASIVVAGPGGPVTFNVGYTGNSSAHSFTGGNDVVLQVAVPEPCPAGLLISAAGLLAGMNFLRRRR